MKALSLRQPWTWLVATGIKDVENRTWKTNFRGRILIHAGKSFDTKVQGVNEKWIRMLLTPDELVKYENADFVRGVIIGEVTITDCRFRHGDMNDNLFSRWAVIGLYGFVLADPILYEYPVICSGRLGFFEPEIIVPNEYQKPIVELKA